MFFHTRAEHAGYTVCSFFIPTRAANHDIPERVRNKHNGVVWVLPFAFRLRFLFGGCSCIILLFYTCTRRHSMGRASQQDVPKAACSGGIIPQAVGTSRGLRGNFHILSIENRATTAIIYCKRSKKSIDCFLHRL